MAVIIQDGLDRMYTKQENKFYYITAMNENYSHPEMPVGVEQGIIKGIYRLVDNNFKSANRVQLMGSGTILREIEAAVALLNDDWSVAADVWSITSANELRRDGLACQRWNMLHPEETPKVPYITEQLQEVEGPFIAATDYMKLYTDQLRPYVPGRFNVLGTDGFGRSDTRAKLRHFFEVNRYFIVISALSALVDEAKLDPSVIKQALKKYGISADKVDPTTV
jgi:pyruvate dehydrogenase E1 component